MLKPEFLESMQERWFRLWHVIEAKGDALPFFNLLAALYSQSHRAYHVFPHIGDGLDRFSEAKIPRYLRGVTDFSFFLHDAIYDTNVDNPRNEKRSAELARGIIRCASLPQWFEERVVESTLATSHTELVQNYWAQVVCDADLASLGYSWEVFEENGRKIRFEYKHVPEDIFLKERKRILKSFLDRENIFYLPYFRDKYEAQARQNLTRSVEQLSRQLKH